MWHQSTMYSFQFVMHLKGYVMKFEGCDGLTVEYLKGKR